MFPELVTYRLKCASCAANHSICLPNDSTFSFSDVRRNRFGISVQIKQISIRSEVKSATEHLVAKLSVRGSIHGKCCQCKAPFMENGSDGKSGGNGNLQEMEMNSGSEGEGGPI